MTPQCAEEESSKNPYGSYLNKRLNSNFRSMENEDYEYKNRRYKFHTLKNRNYRGLKSPSNKVVHRLWSNSSRGS